MPGTDGKWFCPTCKAERAMPEWLRTVEDGMGRAFYADVLRLEAERDALAAENRKLKEALEKAEYWVRPARAQVSDRRQTAAEQEETAGCLVKAHEALMSVLRTTTPATDAAVIALKDAAREEALGHVQVWAGRNEVPEWLSRELEDAVRALKGKP